MPSSVIVHPSRRSVMAIGLACLAAPAWSAPPPEGRLAFTVFRNGARIGEHRMTFAHEGETLRVDTRMAVVVRLGPIPVFHYTHTAQEIWRDGAFERLQSATSSNGKREHVLAQKSGGGVIIETASGRLRAPGTAAPLTHWNPAVFQGPMFNPQTGRLMKLNVRRSAAPLPAPEVGEGVRWSVRGEAEVDDWYDAAGVWSALHGRLTDGSTMEYRRT